MAKDDPAVGISAAFGAFSRPLADAGLSLRQLGATIRGFAGGLVTDTFERPPGVLEEAMNSPDIQRVIQEAVSVHMARQLDDSLLAEAQRDINGQVQTSHTVDLGAVHAQQEWEIQWRQFLIKASQGEGGHALEGIVSVPPLRMSKPEEKTQRMRVVRFRKSPE
jgi:hypothetical protein